MPTPPIADDVLHATVEAWEKHGKVVLHAAKAIGIGEATFRRRLKRARERFGAPAAKPSGGAAQPAPHGLGKTIGRSLDEFKATHDRSFIVPRKIKEALQALGHGGWEYESNFVKLCGISLADLSNFRDAFSAHIVVVKRDGKRAWAGTPSMAQKMREMLA